MYTFAFADFAAGESGEAVAGKHRKKDVTCNVQDYGAERDFVLLTSLTVTCMRGHYAWADGSNAVLYGDVEVFAAAGCGGQLSVPHFVPARHGADVWCAVLLLQSSDFEVDAQVCAVEREEERHTS